MKELQMADGRQNRKRRSRSKTGRKNPAAAEALRKKWQDPEYRATQTKFNKEVLPIGRRTRVGVPDGMTREEAEPFWQQAREQAEAILTKFEDEGRVEFDIDVPDEQMARLALREALVMALSPLTDAQIKARNVRIVLDWTKPKPGAKAETHIHSPEFEAWFASVLEDLTTGSAA
jgi:hypothetical protein